jgi:hypothetical protein
VYISYVCCALQYFTAAFVLKPHFSALFRPTCILVHWCTIMLVTPQSASWKLRQTRIMKHTIFRIYT